MQKKKTKITKFDQNREIDLFRSLVDDLENDQDYIPGIEEMMGRLISSAMNSAVELTKVVAENRKLNSQKMDDEDIYKIYDRAFKSILRTTEKG